MPRRRALAGHTRGDSRTGLGATLCSPERTGLSSALIVFLAILQSLEAHAHVQPSAATPTEVLFVNRGATEPASPLELTLTVRLFSERRTLEILARAGRHPAYPSALFDDKNVTVRFTLPAGTALEDGSLSWTGDLRGDEVAEVLIRVKVSDAVDGFVEASVIGHAAGGRIDGDVERFYVVSSADAIKLSRDPRLPGNGGRPPPGSSTR